MKMINGIIVILIGILGTMSLAMALAMIIMAARFKKPFTKEKVFFTSIFLLCLVILLVLI